MSQDERTERNRQRAADTPRFSTLAICVRGALRGWHDRSVQHMLERNREVEMMRATGQFDRRAAAVMKHRSVGASTGADGWAGA